MWGRFWGWGWGAASLSPHPDEIEPRPVFEKQPLVWEDDMELYSRFVDRKVREAAAGPGSPFPLEHNPHTITDLPRRLQEMHTPRERREGRAPGAPGPGRAHARPPPGGAASQPRQLPAAAPRGPGARLGLPALPAPAPAGRRGHLRRRVLRSLREAQPADPCLALLRPAQPLPLAGPRAPHGLGLAGRSVRGLGRKPGHPCPCRGRRGTRSGSAPIGLRFFAGN